MRWCSVRTNRDIFKCPFARALNVADSEEPAFINATKRSQHTVPLSPSKPHIEKEIIRGRKAFVGQNQLITSPSPTLQRPLPEFDVCSQRDPRDDCQANPSQAETISFEQTHVCIWIQVCLSRGWMRVWGSGLLCLHSGLSTREGRVWHFSFFKMAAKCAQTALSCQPCPFFTLPPSPKTWL